MKLRVNGQDLEWNGGSLADLLRRQGVDPAQKGYAVALNGEVLAREDWAAVHLAQGDRIEIVGMYKGG